MAMANMSELQQRNFMDVVNFGSVINREGAAAAAMSQGLTDSVNSYADQFARGQLTPESVREANKQLGEQTKQEILNLREIGLAGAAGVGGIVSELAKILGGELAFRNKTTKESIEDAERSAREQKEARDELTANFRKATTASQNFAIEFEKIATELLPKYSSLLLGTLGVLSTMLSKIPGLEGFGEAFKKVQVAMVKDANQAETVLETLGLDAERKKQIGDLLKDEKTRIQGIEEINKEIRQQSESEGKQTSSGQSPTGGAGPVTINADRNNPLPVTIVDPLPEGAKGGVISGPRSGYFAVLHGNEMVIPEGGTIAVKSSIVNEAEPSTGGIDIVTPLMNALAEQTKKFNLLIEINEGMLAAIGDHKDVSTELLKNAYS